MALHANRLGVPEFLSLNQILVRRVHHLVANEARVFAAHGSDGSLACGSGCTKLMSSSTDRRSMRAIAVRDGDMPASDNRACVASRLRGLHRITLGKSKDSETAASIDVRDAALVAVLHGAELQRAEVVQLDVGDLAMESGALVMRWGPSHPARSHNNFSW
jgi:site-specific recombinase XerC